MCIVVELKAVKLLSVPGAGEVNLLYGLLGLWALFFKMEAVL